MLQQQERHTCAMFGCREVADFLAKKGLVRVVGDTVEDDLGVIEVKAKEDTHGTS